MTRQSMVRSGIGRSIGRCVAFGVVALTMALLGIRMARAANDGASTPAKQYVLPGISTFDPAAPMTSVGNFGAFSNGTDVHERGEAGMLTFAARRELSGNGPASAWFYWTGLDNGNNLDIGNLIFPGQVVRRHQTLLSWTTTRWEFDTKPGMASDDRLLHSRIHLSRTFPALLADSTADTWTWSSANPRIRFTALAYPDQSGHWQTISMPEGADTTVLNGSQLSAPYVILWNRATTPQAAGIVPLLVRFQKRPARLTLSRSADADGSVKSSVKSDYPAGMAAGSFVIMPLLGVTRPIGVAADAWRDSPPPAAREQAEFWSSACGAFPTGIAESYKVDDAAGLVTIHDHYDYLLIHDDWNTRPLTLAPAPPLTALAQSTGYPVVWKNKGGPVERSSLTTFLGPYAYSEGSDLTYTLPLLTARDQMLAPVAIVNGNASQTATQSVLNDYVLSHPPIPPVEGNGGVGVPIKDFAEAYPTVSPEVRKELAPVLTQSIAAAFGSENLQTVIEPLTGQRYVMSTKIWCAKEPYDREWYAGRQLDGLGEYAQWVDRSVLRSLYPAAQGLYAYYRLYNDWAWSGTSSSAYGFNLTGDGMNFALEGMLAMARTAHRMGDDETRDDALYRSAKQAIPSYAEFVLPKWLKSINAAVWTDTSYDPTTKKGQYKTRQQAPKDVIIGFGIDGYADDCGARTLRPNQFWHASAAIFWNNPSLYRLYLENGLYNGLYRWEYVTMPKLHPHWDDHGTIQVYENQPYGGGNSAAHIVARSVLFGEPGAELKGHLDKMGDMEQFQYVGALRSVLQSDIPQAWIPASRAHFVSNVWDAKTGTLITKLVADEDGIGGFDVAWREWVDPRSVAPNQSVVPSAGAQPASVRVNGKNVAVKGIKGGFWHTDIPLKKSETVTVTTKYIVGSRPEAVIPVFEGRSQKTLLP